MEVVIKGQKWKFEFDGVWGPLYTYEEVCGPALPFDPKKTICLHVMWWCILLRANEGCTVTLDEFIEALNDMRLVEALRDYYSQRMEVLTTVHEEAAQPETDKKKD
jgi:hypothetical protein